MSKRGLKIERWLTGLNEKRAPIETTFSLPDIEDDDEEEDTAMNSDSGERGVPAQQRRELSTDTNTTDNKQPHDSPPLTESDDDDDADKENSRRRPPHWANRKMTYTTIKSNPFISPQACRALVKMPNVIVMVGLPARGKTYISRKLCRYLNWIGIRTKAFNLGDYRRSMIEEKNSDFFAPDNERGVKIRDECAARAMKDMCSFLNRTEGEVAIFDATNTTRERRNMVIQNCSKRYCFRVFFVESVCDDQKIIDTNIQDVKVNSPDYKGSLDTEKAKDDFLKRIEHYNAQYEPLDAKLDNELSFIKVINAGSSFYVQNVAGHVQSRVVYFLMNIHLMPRSIYLTRHGESEFNRLGRIGGDAPLSIKGRRYSEELYNYFEEETVSDLRVWCSQKIRAVQTASKMLPMASYVEYWKALDEIDAGICEGLTYEEIAQRYPQQLDNRDHDKYHYRYPSGESYEDLTGRLEPVIMELERQENVLVVSHQAVLRCILAYFLDRDRDALPYLRVPLHSVIKLTPIAYGCRMEIVKFDIEAVDTQREKPAISMMEWLKQQHHTQCSSTN